MVPDYKNLVLLALTGNERPSWVRVVHLRTNSMGHSIRISFNVTDRVRDELAEAIHSKLQASLVCGDGVLRITSLSFSIRYR